MGAEGKGQVHVPRSFIAAAKAAFPLPVTAQHSSTLGVKGGTQGTRDSPSQDNSVSPTSVRADLLTGWTWVRTEKGNPTFSRCQAGTPKSRGCSTPRSVPRRMSKPP